MKKKRAKKTLGRTAQHRTQMFKLLSSQLLHHGHIVTTSAKAKELKKIFERLVTHAKRDITLARRRRLLQRIAYKKDLQTLLEVAAANKKRPGGYLRITKLPNRQGDAAALARIDIIDRS